MPPHQAVRPGAMRVVNRRVWTCWIGGMACALVAAAHAQVTDLGPCVFGATTHAAAFGTGPDGRLQVYVLQDGALDHGRTPAHLIVADVETGKVSRTLVLPGSEGGWALTVASDGVVYAGIYRNGHVFRHFPGSNDVTDLGPALDGQRFLYGFCAGRDGEIFGGSFPGGQVFRYSPKAGFDRIGENPVLPGIHQPPSYVRGVAFDSVRGRIYAGTGPGAQLACLDLRTGRTVDILPPEFRETDFLYGMKCMGSKVLIRLIKEARIEGTF